MPIGLISLRYLYENFGAADYQLPFTDEEIQPSVRTSPFREDDIHVFRWDADRRTRLWGNERANAFEKERFSDWWERFGEAFDRGLADDAPAFPHLFTPASAKALNLFFNCCNEGQMLANKYRSTRP